jgi:Cu/Ag efflux protein CusF
MKPTVLSALIILSSLNAEAAIAASFSHPSASIRPGSLLVQIQSSGQQLYRGVGVVTSVDAPAGVVTIDHKAIPGLMGAMKMAYTVSPKSLAGGVKEGDRVVFEVDGKNYTIFSLSKEPKSY